MAEFTVYCNPNRDKLIVLLFDRAGWHMNQETTTDKTIRLFPLPPYTPELQPVECAWPLVKESLANKTFTTLDELEETLIPRCQWLHRHPDVVKGEVGFDWIQKIETRIN